MSDTTPTPQPDTIVFVDPEVLGDHPLLAAMPAVRREDPEIAGFIETVRAAGRIDVPIIIDEERRILDGRKRRITARVLGLPLPAIVRSTSEAATVVLHSLAGRRNLTKGALAYLALPLLRPVLDEIRQRWVATLRSGTATTISNPVGNGQKTITALAAELGFSDELLRQAQKVHDALADTTPRFGEREQDGAPFLTYRQHFEPALFAGEIGLGGILQAIAGKESTEGKAKTTRPVDTLFSRDFEALTKRFSTKWEALSPEARRPVAQAAATTVCAWPEDVQRAVLAQLRKTLKPGGEPTY